APTEDGAVVAEPPLSSVGKLLAENRRRLAASGLTVLGRPRQELRRDARRTLLETASRYLTRFGEPAPDLSSIQSDSPILMAGHQPELFHPGVWVKNLALAGLSRAHSGGAVNLVVEH